MTDSARDAAHRDELPSPLRHPLANVRAVRELWTPFMGEQLAARFASGQLYFVLSLNFLIWGVVGGAVVAIIGGVIRGSQAGPVFGIALGISVVVVGLMLAVIASNSQRGVALLYLPYVRELRPKVKLGRLTALFRQGSEGLLELIRLHPEAFPKPR